MDNIYCESKKNKAPYSCLELRQILTNFKNSFTSRIASKFAVKPSLNIPPHLKHVATLPCEEIIIRKLAIIWNLHCY